MFRTQNLCPQHMFPARLNWETFASATMFPILARPLETAKPPENSAKTENRIQTTLDNKTEKPLLFSTKTGC